LNSKDTTDTFAELALVKQLLLQTLFIIYLYPGLPWIWISMDISMDIVLSHLLIKLNI